MSWFKTGFDGVEQQVKANEEQRNNKAPRRLWMPQNSEKKVIYLDEQGFTFYEHAFEANGRYDNFLTCPGRVQGCPLCASGKKPYLVTLFSVIDRSQFTDKQGVERKDEKKIHGLKAESALAFKRKIDRWGGLRGRQVVISRKGGKDASSGSDFEPDMKDGKMLVFNIPSNDEKYKPFDYPALFAPKPVSEMCAILGIAEEDSRSGKGVSLSGGPKPSGLDLEPDFGGSSAAVAFDDSQDVPF